MKKIPLNDVWVRAKQLDYSLFVKEMFFKIKGYSDGFNDENLFLAEVKPQRSQAQHNSIWLFCTWIADIFNEIGRPYINPMGIETIWTKDLVYNVYWKPLMIQLYSKEHISDLLSNEISPIADALIKHFAEKGYDLEFPNFQSFLNKIEAKNFDN